MTVFLFLLMMLVNRESDLTPTVPGYEKQLEIYKKADDTNFGVFLIIDVGGIGRKLEKFKKLRNYFIKTHGMASDVWYVDGSKKPSASKRFWKADLQTFGIVWNYES